MCSMKKGAFRNFTKFTGKHLRQSLRPAALLNKRLWHRCFTVSFAKFLRTPSYRRPLNYCFQWFVTEILIFRSSHSQMFFKISVTLEPLPNNKVADLLLPNTYGGCFWIFVAANTFLQLNMVFIADSRSCFCSGLLWKHELNFKKQPLKLFCKKGVLIKFANFTGKRLYWSLFLIELRTFTHATLLKRDANADVLFWNF